MDPKFYQYVKSGKVCSLKHVLYQNPGLLFKVTPQENTALHIAVKFGHMTIVTEIYGRCGSLLSKQNLDGDTPLHIAARAGHLSIIDFLVKEIFSSMWRETDEDEIIGKFEILRMGNKENNTVLHEAVRNGHLRVVQLLLKIDPKLACLENFAGESALYLASREGMLEIVNEILTSTNKSAAYGGSEGQTALHAAVIGSHYGTMQALLRAKRQLIREVDHHGRTSLHHAASLGDHKTVKQLLDLDNAVVYILDKHGHSPLYVAASNGHVNVIREIIRQCPDSAELLDLCGRNALHAAILSGKGNVIRYMLETAETEGLINQPDNDGNTPLLLATIGRKIWIVRYLIWDKRVDQRTKNKNGQTAFDLDPSIRESCLTVPRKAVSIIRRKFSSLPTGSIREDIPPSANHEAEDAKMQSYRQMGQTLLMVTTLITTVTFAAAFTMPGGYQQNGAKQGMALLDTSKNLKLFVIYDVIAMTCSTTAACLLFWGVISGKKSYPYCLASATLLTYIALQATAGAFLAGINTVLPQQPYIVIMSIVLDIGFHISTCLLLFHLFKVFHVSEVSQFFISHLYKLKFKKR
ncbi:protein ACCELERATED CELL DEATH 6-like [Durio zibethinus]|uniref:Protein ACCELERATED CELL DEATH 6-like n=1 Tax=Durio zibethinus TaxID=66656 RepID=A0A6P5WLU0_DURZI|nr:protein ACCELERATED CELL DEATH 6-like [Durio zibethinus]